MTDETRNAARGDLVGRTLGDFVVVEKFGAGGFGEVYRAEQPVLCRQAVIKVLHKRHQANQELIGRFMREAQLASQLEHPYAAHVYAFGAEPDGLLWIAMEMVRGTALDQMLRTRGPLALEQLVPLLERICEVVHTAHEQGIVHRDLKPANVLVIARAGRLLPKLLDFGIAKSMVGLPTAGERPAQTTLARAEPRDARPGDPIDDNPALAPTGRWDAQLTRRGDVFGSPAYMAPEQWVNAPSVGARADIYALGIMAYELLVGQPPFEGESVEEIAIGHAREPLPSLDARYPDGLHAVLSRAVAKRAGDRYETALELGAAFRHAAGMDDERDTLPHIDELLRDSVLASAPQPLAETVAALDAARNAHQARDAARCVVATAARLVGLLTVACRSRVGSGGQPHPTRVVEAFRALRRERRGLDPSGWTRLARDLCRPFARQRDAYPIPEIVELFYGVDGAELATDAFTAVLATTHDTVSAEVSAGGAGRQLETMLPRIESLLRALAFLSSYRLVLAGQDGAERWSGVRRSPRAVCLVSGAAVEPGTVALLDAETRPVLSLWPLIQVAAPAPGAAEEMFLLEGNGRHGAQLVAYPGGFKRHDDTVWSWFRELFADSLDPEGSAEEERPPYPGLAAFTAEDAEIFFGREREAEAFLNRLRVSSLLVVVGASGTGKSSFVQAGVVPDLAEGSRAVILRPGSTPTANLVAALARAGLDTTGLSQALEADPAALGVQLREQAQSGGSVFLLVDQLEELFTLCSDESERQRFAAALGGAARLAEDPVRVVATLRDDFLARTQELAALRNRLAQSLHLLGTPARSDLLRIVTEPAQRSGYVFEDPGLPDEMVAEVAEQPGALPLLAFTAARLWDLRDRHFRQLPRKAYEAFGGVGGALAHHAEDTLSHMGAESRRLVREAFRHLVTSEGTRAVLTWSELIDVVGGGKRAEAVVERLIAARLLVVSEAEGGEDRVEVVHEALLSAWPRLVRWRREDAEGARLRDQLREAARQWEERDRPKGLLWRDEPLTEYKLWRARYPGSLTVGEERFASASLAEAARSRRVRRALVGTAFVALVAGLIVVLFFADRASQQRDLAELNSARAEDQLTALYEEQGRQALMNGRAMHALVYLVEAYRRGADSPRLRLLLSLAARPVDAQLRSFDGHTDRVHAASFNADGTRILTASDDGTARIWEASTGSVLLTLRGHEGAVWSARFSPDGTRVVSSGEDGTAKVWDAGSGVLVASLDGHPGRISTAELDASGSFVVAAVDPYDVSAEGAAWVWQVDGPTRLFVLPHASNVVHATFSPDGRLVATASSDGTAKLWNRTNGGLVASLEGHSDVVSFAAFSPDGSLVATASFDGTARIWDARTGALVHALKGHVDMIERLAFNRDGTRLVTASHDRTALIWDVSTGEPLVACRGHAGGVESVAFDSDGWRVLTSSFDGTARIWDARTGTQLASLEGHGSDVRYATFDRTGERVLTASWDGTAKLWDASNTVLAAALEGHRDQVWDATFSPDGTQIVTASRDATAALWDAATGERLHSLAGHAAHVSRVRFSNDGARLITASEDRTARVWDARTGTLLATLEGHSDGVSAAEISPRSDMIATTGTDGTLRIWDGHTYQLLGAIDAHDGPVYQGPVWSHLFGPDGSFLVTGSWDGTAKLWNADNRSLAATLGSHTGHVTDVAISADGRWLATTSEDKTAKVWDRQTGALVHTLRHRGVTWSARFSADGRRLVVACEESPRMWDLETGRLLGSLEHGRPVPRATFSPDGGLVATAGNDRRVKIWDASTSRLLATLAGHSDVVLEVRFDREGSRLVSASWDNSARIWDLRRETRRPDELASLVRCRVPLGLLQGEIVPREIDRADCQP